LSATATSGVTIEKNYRDIKHTVGVASKRDVEDGGGMWNGWNDNGVFPIPTQLRSPRDLGGLTRWVSEINPL